jgi:hypothetical protein
MVGCLEFLVQEIKRTLTSHLLLRLLFRRNASFTRSGFGPTGSVRLSLDKLVSHRPVTGQQHNHDVAGAAYRHVQTLRFLYIRLPLWDRLAL